MIKYIGVDLAEGESVTSVMVFDGSTSRAVVAEDLTDVPPLLVVEYPNLDGDVLVDDEQLKVALDELKFGPWARRQIFMGAPTNCENFIRDQEGPTPDCFVRASSEPEREPACVPVRVTMLLRADEVQASDYRGRVGENALRAVPDIRPEETGPALPGACSLDPCPHGIRADHPAEHGSESTGEVRDPPTPQGGACWCEERTCLGAGTASWREECRDRSGEPAP